MALEILLSISLLANATKSVLIGMLFRLTIIHAVDEGNFVDEERSEPAGDFWMKDHKQ
ncbi:unnamed protein product [Ilex paraguariensis]|uniref:Uncharacterized protein n=1 Tax=Ilex paraguariensis TaxID=185542 RepID=A0ABC8SEM7_9AQUA